eukprot:416487_1
MTSLQTMSEEQVKITVIGDEEIGKTCLLMSYRPKAASECPSIFNHIQIEKDVNIDGNIKSLELLLCDTGATDEYKQLRCKAYRNVDVILITFDILNISSLESVDTKWIEEIKQYASDAVLVLVGLKSDKRSKNNDENENEIPKDVIDKYLSKYNFIDYVETSALKKKNVDLAFEVGIAEFIISGGKHRQSTQITTDDEEPDINDISSIVGTHKKQWHQHLKDQGLSSEDVFNQYKDATSIASMGNSGMAAMVGSPQYGMGTMSYGHGGQSYNMVQQQRLAAMSYQSGYSGQSYAPNGSGNIIQNNIIVEDKEDDVPPPPPAPL